MGKGARLRDGGRRVRSTSEKPPVGHGRPVGAARRAMRARTMPSPENAVQPWQGYGNAILLGKAKVAAWKRGRTKGEISQLNAYLESVHESGQVKTLEDVVQVRERDDQERHVFKKGLRR